MEEEISKVLQDSNIMSYFINKKIKIYDFIKTYIEVDKIISSTNIELETNVMYSKMDEIRNILINNSNQINTLNNSISNANTTLISLLQNKIEAIKEITNNDIKLMFIELQKQLAVGPDTSQIKMILENFKDKIEILNDQKLNDHDRNTLDTLSKLQTSMIQILDTHSVSQKIESIEKTVNAMNENFSSNSAKKGQIAETILLNVLTENFPDTEIIDTSHQANSGDIQMLKENRPVILIDSKNFGSKTVPKRDLDKFYNDIQQNNCCGILCNAFGGIANKSHFEIDIVDKNVVIFIWSHQFDHNLFKLATNIIYGLHQEIKEKQSDSIVLDQSFFQNLKIEYNYYTQSFKHHLDIIKSNINSLSQLSFTLLDNFFKRKNTNSSKDIKPFVCNFCGIGVSTAKILKNHIKKQHPINHERGHPINHERSPSKKEEGEEETSNNDNLYREF